MTYEAIEFERDGEDKFATVVLNRPDKMNTLNTTLIQELEDVVKMASTDPEINALLITGRGKAFSAGYDMAPGSLGDELDIGIDAWRDTLLGMIQNMYTIWNAPIATVAAINGYALGGGLELSMCCDVSIASEDAMLGEPEIRHVSAPPTLILPWTVPIRHARHLIYTGDMIDAKEAERIHLVNKTVPADELMDVASRWARKLARIPTPSIKYNKAAINNVQLGAGLYDSWLYNAETTAMVHSVPEGSEWMRKLNEMTVKEFLKTREAPFKELDKA